VGFNPTEVKTVMERLRAAVRESVKASEQSKFLATIDALEADLMARSRDAIRMRSHLQNVRDTSRRVLRPSPQSMVRILKAVDGVEEDLQKILDAMGESSGGA
jgi:hypothetical protein